MDGLTLFRGGGVINQFSVFDLFEGSKSPRQPISHLRTKQGRFQVKLKSIFLDFEITLLSIDLLSHQGRSSFGSETLKVLFLSDWLLG